MVMKRKVLKIGQSSLAVSLPSKWAKEHSLNAGDEIELAAEHGDLVIRGEGSISEGRELEFVCPPIGVLSNRIVVSPYIQGYDCVRIGFMSQEQHEFLLGSLKALMGFEVISETNNLITFKNVAKGIEDEFDNLFRRLFHITNLIGDSVLAFVSGDTTVMYSTIKEYEQTSNKLTNFCKRILNTQPRGETRKVTSKYQVICLTEIVGDMLRKIARYLDGETIRHGTEKELATLVALCKETFEIYLDPSYLRVVKHRHDSIDLEYACAEKAKRGKQDGFILGKISEMSHLLRELTLEIQYPLKE